jgi:hypothetical protein
LATPAFLLSAYPDGVSIAFGDSSAAFRYAFASVCWSPVVSACLYAF